MAAEDGLRQARAAKHVRQRRLHGAALLIGTGHQVQGEAGVVIEQAPGMDAALPHRRLPHEVHLPQRGGFRVRKALEWHRRRHGHEPPAAAQHIRDGAGCGVRARR